MNGREASDVEPVLNAVGDVEQYIFCSSAGVYLKSDQMPHREEDATDQKSRHKVTTCIIYARLHRLAANRFLPSKTLCLSSCRNQFLVAIGSMPQSVPCLKHFLASTSFLSSNSILHLLVYRLCDVNV